MVLLGYGRQTGGAVGRYSGCTEGSPLKGGTLVNYTGVSVIIGG